MENRDRNSVLNDTAIFAKTDSTDINSPYDLLDDYWVKSAFMISDAELDNATDIANRYWSSASAKFTDSGIGNNFGINSPAQYTPYADFPQPGRLQGRVSPQPTDTSGNYGLGVYYSEAVDDTQQRIHMRFGVPRFNSLLNYFMRAFDTNQSTLARTGRLPSVVYDITKTLGTYVAVVGAPAIAITVLGGRVAGYFFNRSTSKFYTMKPTMHLYWSTVNTLVNTLAINIGIFPKVMNANSDDTQQLGRPFVIDDAYLTAFREIAPDIFGSQNYFDVFAIANRAQRLANQIHSEEYQRFDASSPTDFTGYLNREITGDGTHSNKVMKKNGEPRLSDFLDETFKLSRIFEKKAADSGAAETDPRINNDSPDGAPEDKSWLKEYAAYFDSEFRMGSQFAVFNVDYTGPVTTSFSNTTGQSKLASKLNDASSNIREARFAMAEGNIIGGVIGELQEGLKDAAMGFINGVTLDMGAFLKGIMGDGFVDIPEHWMNSGVQLPETTYTMTLTATYNTPISRMTKLYIPICMLLAGALPRSIGKQAYTSPFLCQIYDKGRNQIRLGIIKSLSITAGSGSHIGFDHRGNPLSFDISMVVSDLSSVMHMPVSGGSLLSADMTLDEDNILSDYLAVLASQDIYTQIYPMAAARMNAAKAAMNLGKWSSPAFWAAATYDSSTSGMLQYLTLGAGNILEGVVRGAETAAGRA